MSSATTTTATVQERSTQATRDLCAALDLGVLSAANLKFLALALMQVATQRIQQDTTFADQVRTAYQSLLPAPKVGRSGASASPGAVKSWQVKLIPIGRADDSLLDPYGPPNPFALQQIYGDEQLALALGRHTPAELRESVLFVQQRYPGTKPKKMTKAGIIDYIVETLTTKD